MGRDREAHRQVSNGWRNGEEDEERLGVPPVKLLLQNIAETSRDSRELAAIVVLRQPPSVQSVLVYELLGWIRGSTAAKVTQYMWAATIDAAAKVGDLTAFQRAALIGALRLHLRRGKPRRPDRS